MLKERRLREIEDLSSHGVLLRDLPIFYEQQTAIRQLVAEVRRLRSLMQTCRIYGADAMKSEALRDEL